MATITTARWRALLTALAAMIACAAAAVVAPLGGLERWAVTAVAIIIAGALVHLTVGVTVPTGLSVPAVWFLTFICFILIPGHIVAADHGHSEPTVRFLAAARLGLLTTALGVWLTGRAFDLRRGDVRRHFTTPVEIAGLGSHFALLFGGVAALAFLLTVQYVREAPALPLIQMIRHPGDYFVLTFLREASLKLLASPFRYAYFVLQVFGYPFLIMIAWGMYRSTRTRGWLFAFVTLVGAGLFFASLSLAKAPVANIILLLLIYHYLLGGGRVTTRAVVIGSVLFLSFPIVVVMGISENLGVGFDTALQVIGRRIFYAPALTLFHYFQAVPSLVEFQGGRTIGLLTRLLGIQYFDIENFVAVVIERSSMPSGSANAAYVGNLYVDWGFAGVGVGGLAAGFLLAAAQLLIVRLRRTPVTLAATAHLMFAAILLSMTSLPTVLMSFGGLLAVVALFFIPAGVDFLRAATSTTLAPVPRAAGTAS